MKAILMLNEMPKKCEDCPCAYEWANECNATDKAVIDFTEKPEWCPLIEINDNIARLIEVAR